MVPNPRQVFYEETVSVTKSENLVYDEMRCKNESKYLAKIRDLEKRLGFVTPLKWTNIIYLITAHLIILTWFGYNIWNGIYVKWQTVLFIVVYTLLGAFGVTAGVHRLWSHRSYRAAPALRWLLGLLFNIAGQNKMYDWIRDHRVHHKWSETAADPHDATRGLFFSHMGWLMMRKRPDVLREGKNVYMTDIDIDPVVQFNSKYFIRLKLLFCVVIPMSAPPLLWGERWDAAALAQLLCMFKSLHWVWSVNSFAHFSGSKPYNPNINPSQNWLVSLMTIGEGWHNYHHTFPWDYKAAELPYMLNVTTLLLDGFAKIGMVSHRKVASPRLVQATIQRNQQSQNYLKNESEDSQEPS